MARELFCRYEGCGFAFTSVAGMLPLVCPKCQKSAKWSTAPRADGSGEPSTPFVLSYNDRRMLHTLRIDPEEEEEDGA